MRLNNRIIEVDRDKVRFIRAGRVSQTLICDTPGKRNFISRVIARRGTPIGPTRPGQPQRYLYPMYSQED